VDECASSPCVNSGSCVGGRCTCSARFTGERCETAVDECASSPCVNGGSCVGGRCTCSARFTGERCETAVDECASSPCVNGGVCLQELCVCSEFFTGERCESFVDMCESSPCADGYACQSSGRAFLCECIDVCDGSASSIGASSTSSPLTALLVALFCGLLALGLLVGLLVLRSRRRRARALQSLSSGGLQVVSQSMFSVSSSKEAEYDELPVFTCAVVGTSVTAGRPQSATYWDLYAESVPNAWATSGQAVDDASCTYMSVAGYERCCTEDDVDESDRYECIDDPDSPENAQYVSLSTDRRLTDDVPSARYHSMDSSHHDEEGDTHESSLYSRVRQPSLSDGGGNGDAGECSAYGSRREMSGRHDEDDYFEGECVRYLSSAALETVQDEGVYAASYLRVSGHRASLELHGLRGRSGSIVSAISGAPTDARRSSGAMRVFVPPGWTRSIQEDTQSRIEQVHAYASHPPSTIPRIIVAPVNQGLPLFNEITFSDSDATLVAPTFGELDSDSFLMHGVTSQGKLFSELRVSLKGSSGMCLPGRARCLSTLVHRGEATTAADSAVFALVKVSRELVLRCSGKSDACVCVYVGKGHTGSHRAASSCRCAPWTAIECTCLSIRVDVGFRTCRREHV
jgi:hypothetical protein